MTTAVKFLEELINNEQEITLKPCGQHQDGLSQGLCFFIAILVLCLFFLYIVNQSWIVYLIVLAFLLLSVLWKHHQTCYIKIAPQYLELKGIVGENKLIRWTDIRGFALKSSKGTTSLIINMKYSPVIDFRSLFFTLKFDELTLEQLLALLIKAKEKYSHLEDF